MLRLNWNQRQDLLFFFIGNGLIALGALLVPLAVWVNPDIWNPALGIVGAGLLWIALSCWFIWLDR